MQIPQTQTDLPLVRQTPLNHEVSTQYLYIPSKSGPVHDLRVKVEEGKITEIIPFSGEIDKAIPNSYVVLAEALSHADLNWVAHLRPGTSLPIQHHFYSKETPGWDKMDYIVSGGDTLLKDGVVQSLDSSPNGPSKDHARTAIGLMPNGKWKMVITDSGALLTDLAQYFKKQGCLQAINMDGAGSPTLHLNSEHSPQTYGSNIVVSDAIVVMPRELPTLTNKDKGRLTQMIQKGDLDSLSKLIESRPALFDEQDHMGRNPLQIAVELGQLSIAEYFIQKATPKQLAATDHYGDTVLHSLLRKEQFDLAQEIILHSDPQLLFKSGLGSDTPLDLVLKSPSAALRARVRDLMLSLPSLPLEGNNSSLIGTILQSEDAVLIQHLFSKLKPAHFQNTLEPLFQNYWQQGNRNRIMQVLPHLTDAFIIEAKGHDSTALQHLIQCNDPEIQKRIIPLLRSKLSTEILTFKRAGAGYRNLLETAVDFGNQEAISNLLPQYTDDQLKSGTMLHSLVRVGHAEVKKRILPLLHSKLSKELLLSRSFGGSNLIETAVRNNNQEATHALLPQYSTADLLESPNEGAGILDACLNARNYRLATELVFRFPKQALLSVDFYGQNILHKALRGWSATNTIDPDFLRHLLSLVPKEYLTKKDKDGMDPLHAFVSSNSGIINSVEIFKILEKVYGKPVFLEKGPKGLLSLSMSGSSGNHLLPYLAAIAPQEALLQAKPINDHYGRNILEYAFKSIDAKLVTQIGTQVPVEWWNEELFGGWQSQDFFNSIVSVIPDQMFTKQIPKWHNLLDYASMDCKRSIEFLKKAIEKSPPSFLTTKLDGYSTPIEKIIDTLPADKFMEIYKLLPDSIFSEINENGSSFFFAKKYSLPSEEFSKLYLPRVPPVLFAKPNHNGESFFDSIRSLPSDRFKGHLAGIPSAAFLLTDAAGKSLFERIAEVPEAENKLIAIAEKLSSKEIRSIKIGQHSLLEWANKNPFPKFKDYLSKRTLEP